MTASNSWRSRPFVGVFLIVACSGIACNSGGGSLNVVKGKVIHKDQPLSGALVTFHPKDQKDFNAVSSTGLTGDDGTFTMMTGKNQGVAAGEYVVTIICTRMPNTDKKSFSTGGMDSVDILQGAYANRDASKITVTVKSGENQLEPFVLK